jgi:FtsZ-binding cell division protein ZapB
MEALLNTQISYQTDPMTVAYDLHTYRRSNPGISRHNLCQHFAHYGLNIKSAHQYIAPLNAIGGWPEDVRARAREMGLKWTKLRVLANKDLNEIRRELGLAEIIPHITRGQVQELGERIDDLKSEVLGIDRAQEDLQQTLAQLRTEQSEFFTRVQTQILSSVSKTDEKNMQDMAAYVDQRLEQHALTVAAMLNSALLKHTETISALIEANQKPQKAPEAPVKANGTWRKAIRDYGPRIAFSGFLVAILGIFVALLIKTNAALLGGNVEAIALATALEGSALGLALYHARSKRLRWACAAAVAGLALLSGSVLHVGNAKAEADEIARIKHQAEVGRRAEVESDANITSLRIQEKAILAKIEATPLDWQKVLTRLDSDLQRVREQITAKSSNISRAAPALDTSLEELKRVNLVREALRWTILVLIPLLSWVLKDVWLKNDF